MTGADPFTKLRRTGGSKSMRSTGIKRRLSTSRGETRSLLKTCLSRRQVVNLSEFRQKSINGLKMKFSFTKNRSKGAKGHISKTMTKREE